MNRNVWKIVSVSLALMIVSIIIEIGILPVYSNLNSIHFTLKWLLTIVSKLTSSIGLALLVGCISVRLSRDQEILQGMNDYEKQRLMKAIVSKDNELDSYKEFVLEKLYKLNDMYFKNYRIDGVVKFDQNQVIGIMFEDYYECCRKTSENKISVFFDNPLDRVNKIIIYNPNDLSQYQEFENITKSINNSLGGKYEYQWYVEIPEEFKNMDMIKVHREYTTYGKDHWIQVAHSFFRPTKGVSINMKYDNNLVVKEYSINDTYNVFTTNINNDLRNYSMDTSEWISAWDGISLLISLENE